MNLSDSNRRPPNVLIISFTDVMNEPRVRRQAAAFQSIGWRVTVAGYVRRREPNLDWTIVPIDSGQACAAIPTLFKRLSRIWTKAASIHFWRQPSSRYVWDLIEGIECDLVVANDYFTAPFAERIARQRNIDFVVDVHEYSVEQFSFKNDTIAAERWRNFERPYIDALQRNIFPKAMSITTVCDGISKLLSRDYPELAPPQIVRSVPQYREMPFRPTGGKIVILYHGLAVPTRGLEAAISTVKHLRPEFALQLRLIGSESYLSELKALARRTGVDDRVEFLPAVSLSDLIACANSADIGYVVLENFGPQRQFTLPNKFFEYVMAGLAVVASDFSELRRHIDIYGFGVTIDGMEPESIAARINALRPVEIDALKRKSLAAARELCWEVEQSAFLKACGRSIPRFDRGAKEPVS